MTAHYVIASYDTAQDGRTTELYAIADEWDPSDPSWTEEVARATQYNSEDGRAEVLRLRLLPGEWTQNAYLYRPAGEQE